MGQQKTGKLCECGGEYIYCCDHIEWCKSCIIKKNSEMGIKEDEKENENFNDLIQKMRSKINCRKDAFFKWIQYDKFSNPEKIGEGGFSTVYLVTCYCPLLVLDSIDEEKKEGKKVALKILHDSSMTNNFLNEVKAYSISEHSNILKILGISQNPESKDYVMVLEYANRGNFNYWLNKNYENFNWLSKLKRLGDIIVGLQQIHEQQMVHRDLHTGNILFQFAEEEFLCISDMGLCGKIDNIDESNIYGVMPYIAPEVLRGKPYTKAADIYSFGMIMYFVATGRQPFADYAHDQNLALNICNGIRPEIDEQEAPKCYIDLMKKCWDLNPKERPDVNEAKDRILAFYNSYVDDAETELIIVKYKTEYKEYYDFNMQFKKAEEHRLSLKKNKETTNHPQAIYTSRLLNPFTKDLGYSECLDCVITD
ncbi:hypothetical protein RclHR1_03380012 [Rhizophagus clarus]|uniref:Kinase-like domain-containing protein n=1 Tax=Rhizophagus clarus TaxID=94130 RepID=A0A2Z6RA90_9GLOM|nr:hypothetical protein RclHR1_03380012 [Rhizophagus clarus]GES94787.1 kinase-like domain-containing protein [Rhizophagus clarus]